MDPVLEEIEFLARSSNRVDVLRLLADTAHTRRELAAETGASQPTLGRILRDFEDRNWITSVPGGYEATATGRLVAAGIGELYDILDTERDLRDVVKWLPTDEMGFDLRRLQDARITVPTQTRPSAPVGRVVDLIEDADEVTVLSHAFNDRTLRTVTDWVEAGGRFEAVFSAAAIRAVADDAILADQLRRLLAADGATVRVHDGAVPLAVTLTDGVVSLLLRDDSGRLQAALDTDDAAVSVWARDTYDRYRADSRPLTGELLDETG